MRHILTIAFFALMAIVASETARARVAPEPILITPIIEGRLIYAPPRFAYARRLTPADVACTPYLCSRNPVPGVERNPEGNLFGTSAN